MNRIHPLLRVACLALLPSTTVALPGGEPSEPPLPEESGLLPTTYKTLFQNDAVQVRWGGRTYLDLGYFDTEPSFMGEDGAEFRTTRLYAAGTIHDAVEFKTEMEFFDGQIKFKDVYISMDTPVGDLKAGHFKEPFSIEELTSSRFITFMERSLANTFAPGRNIGLQFSRYYEDAYDLNWALGVFRNSKDGAPSQGDGEYSVTGRVTGTAFRTADSVLHGGFSYALRGDTGGMISFGGRPEVHLVSFPGGSGAKLADDAHVKNFELAWVRGPVSVQGEYAMASVNVNSGSDPDYHGYYVLASYFLTGETRNYKAKGGAFGRIEPLENFDGAGGRGAWELAGRFSMQNFDDGPTTNKTTNYTVGLNWYLNPNTRLMFNYVHSNFEDVGVDDDLDALMLRFQVDF